MAKKIIIPALKIAQSIKSPKSIFLGKLTVEDLIDETQFKIKYWDPDKKNQIEQGYQRRPNKSHYLKVAKYVTSEENPIFPTTVLVSSENELEFEVNDKKNNFGNLILNNYPLSIVDGQHRIEGFKHAVTEQGFEDCKKMELPVVFLSKFKSAEEANQFYILNNTQKKVSTDLAQRLISKLAKENPDEYKKLEDENRLWEVRALAVVDLLNERPDSPWYRMVRLPNSDKMASNIINQTSFVKSLKPLFKDGFFSSIKKVNESYEILKNYWIAVKRVFPDAFVSPKEYVIQKTPGLFSLHELAHKILVKKGENCQKELDFLLILKEVFSSPSYNGDFWRSDGEGAALYGSMKGFRILANKFIDKLPWS